MRPASRVLMGVGLAVLLGCGLAAAGRALAQDNAAPPPDPSQPSADHLVVGPARVTNAPRLTDELHLNDYPTIARADYIFACMQVNGQTRESLESCSCSIDVIASLLTFEQYEEAETVMSVRQRGGENAEMFRSYAPLREKVNALKRAQVEGELRCF